MERFMKIARKLCGNSSQYFVSHDGDKFRSIQELGFECQGLDGIAENREAISTTLTQTGADKKSGDELSIIDEDLLSPISPSGSLIGVGLNYHEHAKESNLAVRANPT